MNDLYDCGPVQIQLSSETPEWYERAAAVLALYTRWEGSQPPLSVHIHTSEYDAAMTPGDYLRTMAVHVDKTAAGLYATCRSGACSRQTASLRRWDIFMPGRYAGGDAGLRGAVLYQPSAMVAVFVQPMFLTKL